MNDDFYEASFEVYNISVRKLVILGFLGDNHLSLGTYGPHPLPP